MWLGKHEKQPSGDGIQQKYTWVRHISKWQQAQALSIWNPAATLTMEKVVKGTFEIDFQKSYIPALILTQTL